MILKVEDISFYLCLLGVLQNLNNDRKDIKSCKQLLAFFFFFNNFIFLFNPYVLGRDSIAVKNLFLKGDLAKTMTWQFLVRQI